MKLNGITWRDYQKRCFLTIRDNYRNNVKSQLITSATGTGKRMMAIFIMAQFKKPLFLAHREELIGQALDDIDKFFPMKSGVIKAERFELDKDIIVASPQTLHRRLNKIPKDRFDCIIVDEAHHYSSLTFRKALDYFDCKLLVGWTATPTRMDNLSLSDIFDKITFEYNIIDGIRDGYLAHLNAIRVKTDVDISGVKKQAGDFNQKELSVKIDTPIRNALIARKYTEYAKDRQGVFFCIDIKHAVHLRDAFRDIGISCETVVSDKNVTPDRKGIDRKFKAGEIQIITNVEIYTEGWDYNDVGVIGMARPTQSLTLFMQAIGRGTRLKSAEFVEKHKSDNCIILDFVDNSTKHALVNTWSIDNALPAEEKMFVTEEKRDKLIFARKEREAKLQTMRKDHKIDLFKMPDVRIIDSPRMRETATPAQITWLIREGVYDEARSYTKYQASEFISNFPASKNQVYRLSKEGYDVSAGVSIGQAQAAFLELESRK